ncbi:hypothetical protein O181_052913 [Austropuccinia psidii MF-1]|uniref:DUF7872 domain-containing protein n=1 Tax=Austropuccinia psidii MF-1 TaxID=1389203 RepID=A0A9Q3E3J3_9BASI|nr:hypothetical protein [Austropuccinia psidii MF-1]
MNSLYRAANTAVELMSEASSSIISDLYVGGVHTFLCWAELTRLVVLLPSSDTLDDGTLSGLYGWAITTIVTGVLGTFTALLVPAFIPADAALASLAAGTAGPGLVATAEMGFGQTKDSPHPGKAAYDAARAALEARDYKTFDELQAAKDTGTIHDVFLPTQDAHHPQSKDLHQELEPSSSASQQETSPHEDSGGGHGSTSGDAPELSKRLRRRSVHHKEGPSSIMDFTRFAYMEIHLNAVKNRIQGFVVATTKFATMNPLLAKGGLAEVLANGTFLNPNPGEDELQQGGKELAQITVLSNLFQSLRYFVTIGSDPCDGNGPNGAWDKKNTLSYCTPDGLMMNIIQANKDKSSNEIPNAHLLSSKYRYSTEFLTKSAWDCQKKYGVYTNSTAPPPSSMRSDCIFQIAVCDCTLAEVADLRKRKKSTVQACREGAHLPI